MVTLRWEDCPKETARTWRLAQRSVSSGARKHDDSVNVDSPHGCDRRKAREAQARSAKGMEAQVAQEGAAGRAGVRGGVACARCGPGWGGPEDRHDHCAAVCGARARVG